MIEMLTTKEIKELKLEVDAYKKKHYCTYGGLSLALGYNRQYIYNCFLANKVSRKFKDHFDALVKRDDKKIQEVKHPNLEKVYLNEMEDIIESLVAGEKVQNDETTVIISMVKGIVCSVDTEGNFIALNPVILSGSKFFVMREKKINLTVGKIYVGQWDKKYIITNKKDDKSFNYCEIGTGNTGSTDVHGKSLGIYKEE